MDAVFEANMSEDTIDRHRPDIQKMRTEIKQVLTASKCLGSWLVALSVTYLCMTGLNWYSLDI
jgi:hypothetical protein